MSGEFPMIPLSDIERMALAIAKSSLFGMKTPEQAIALMLISQAEGRHPALAANDYHIIQGRPAKTSKAMLRDFQAAGGKIEWQERSDTRAAAIFSHPSCPKPVTVDWDLERAKKAGLSGKDMYGKYTRQMLSARVVSEGVGAVLPGATSGFYTPEEVREFAPSIAVESGLIDKDSIPVNLPVTFRSVEEDDGERVRNHEELTEEIKQLNALPSDDDKAMLERLQMATKRVAEALSVSHDEATARLFDSKDMTFEKILKLKTPKQIERARKAIVQSTSILMGSAK